MAKNKNDIQVNTLLSSSTIDYSNQTTFKISDIEAKKIVLEVNTVNFRRSTMKSEIIFLLQKYVKNQFNQSFILLNTDYKNTMKKIPINMKQEENILKQCLLQLSNGKSVLFILPKSLCVSEYNELLLKLKIPNESPIDYDDNLYYKIDVKHIYIEMPPEPESFDQYPNHINEYQEEIRYLIKENYYSYAEKYANIIISHIFNMRKDKKVLLNEELKKQLYKQMKPIILNKTLSITLKEGSGIQKWKQYEEAIKCIEIDYYPYFSNDKDEYYLKITGRYGMYSLKIKQFEKAHKALAELKKHYDNTNEIIIQLEIGIKKSPPIRTTEKLERSCIKAIIKPDNKTQKEKKEEIEFEWEISSFNVLNYLKTDSLQPGIANILNK